MKELIPVQSLGQLLYDLGVRKGAVCAGGVVEHWCVKLSDVDKVVRSTGIEFLIEEGASREDAIMPIRIFLPPGNRHELIRVWWDATVQEFNLKLRSVKTGEVIMTIPECRAHIGNLPPGARAWWLL